MIQITQCIINADSDSEDTRIKEISNILHIRHTDVKSYKILKRSLDARRKPLLHYVYTFVAQLSVNEQKVLDKCTGNRNISAYQPPVSFQSRMANLILKSDIRESDIVIVGAGPAGLFAAYTLVLLGCRPIVVERGEEVADRIKTVRRFWEEGVFDKNSNVSFGEGGAGTFSDGKLNTGNRDKDGSLYFILETFVKFGAPPDILYEAKPHIGTDILTEVIYRMRKEIERLGGVFRFNSTFILPKSHNKKLYSVVIQDNKSGVSETLPCHHCILAIGHSADDTYQMLNKKGVKMQPKAYAVGVRVEHLQEMIDQNQYGRTTHTLSAADYKVTAVTKNNRSIYSFCMCPGGFVVNASSERGKLVINGMSNRNRSERNANSAIVVPVTPNDFEGDDPLAGLVFRQKIESAAWRAGHGKIPVQLYADFVKKRPSTQIGDVTSNTKGGTILCNVRELLPDFIGDAIAEAMPLFGKMIEGFDRKDTLISGVETRTSSPVRIVRN
ncbi:MAG: FAD-dependent monooxygenase, partial [Lachnoclostridium sp.]|nr:FAD-dependent monooxygenase [Lachnoclostridium sp.]